MSTLNFAVGNEMYEVYGTLTRADGTYVIQARELNHSYPANLAWRAEVMILRYPTGYYRFNSWNIGCELIAKWIPAVVAAATEFERLEALKNAPTPSAPVTNEPTPAPAQVSGFDWSNPTVERLIARYTQLGRKCNYSDAEQSRTVRNVAEYYAANYEGTFEFMVSMRSAFDRWGKLTVAQASGTINCLLAEYRRNEADRARKETPEYKAALEADRNPTPTTEVGKQIRAMMDQRTNAASATPLKSEPQAPAPVSNEPVTQVCPNGTFTVVLNEQGDYRTIKLVDAPETMGKPVGTQIASYLSGPDNTSNYTGFAFVSGSRIGTWSKFKADSTLTKALSFLLSSDRERQIDMGEAYAIESGNCFRCGRKLTVEGSIKRGLGPICAEKLGI